MTTPVGLPPGVAADEAPTAFWLQALLEAAQEGVCGVIGGRVAFVSPAFARIVGREAAALPGLDIEEIPVLLELARRLREASELAPREPWMVQGVEDEPTPVRVAARRIEAADPDRAGFVATFVDLTRERELEREAELRALYDPLTGLPNRTLLAQRLDHSLKRRSRLSVPVALLLVDLDRFRRINESFGYPVGDTLLTMVAQRLSDRIRPEDLVARLSGDVFGIVLEGMLDEDAARTVAKRIATAFEEPFLVMDTPVTVDASLGMALNTRSHHNAADLFRSADVALYQAKGERGTSFAIFDPHQGRAAHRRVQTESELRAAADNGQLFLHYQPIIELDTRAIVGAEALVRWNHPTRGITMPTGFLSLAEESGVLPEIGRWVLDTACRDLRSWLDDTLGRAAFVLHLNLAGAELTADLPDRVEAILSEYGVSPSRLLFEVPQDVAITESPTVDRLRESGVKVAVDEVGEGYSLGHLVRLHVDAVKIDRALVGALGSVSRSTTLIETIVALSERMGIQTIAEGIETEEQARKLRSLGCRFGQGYYFAQPRAEDVFASTLRIAMAAGTASRVDPEDWVSPVVEPEADLEG
jgi:diguanylate cyclase (GGDEF)-like protein